ncbi:uncharacterized protein LOC122364099 [Amphibalanus amphitrite]|uniref:uncharacterized protein LOC122364099 n=1 Tax=Amphibalanus amphitrite TaxID=1232801 RepID=UPI001C8FF13B|nr:uncharacterized protein LOC122364099 [Amphibalanus amphitrite]
MLALRCLLLGCVLMTLALADPLSNEADSTDDTEEAKPRILLRKRRTTELPSNANIRFESKLTVPQVPTGLYQVWFGPVRFYIQQLFSSTSARDIADIVSQQLAADRGSASTAALKQLAESSLRQQAAQGSTLFFTGRAVAEDQLNIFQSLEAAMKELGVDGKACLLRTICELQESPVAEWTFAGELITHFLTPKEGNYDFLSDYQQARQLGAEAGGRQRCRAAYSECPLSVFNFIPDMLGEDVLLPLGNITNSLG